METTAKKIHEIDATGISLGRLASRVASLLLGKGMAAYEPRISCKDEVRVTNIAKVKVTGNKMEDKIYRKHTMHPGHLRETAMKKVYAENPAELLIHAVTGMLPKNRQRKGYMSRLDVK